MQGLGPLTNLKILDVSANRISKIQGLDTLTQLEDLWLNNNGERPSEHHSCARLNTLPLAIAGAQAQWSLLHTGPIVAL